MHNIEKVEKIKKSLSSNTRKACIKVNFIKIQIENMKRKREKKRTEIENIIKLIYILQLSVDRQY